MFIQIINRRTGCDEFRFSTRCLGWGVIFLMSNNFSLLRKDKNFLEKISKKHKGGCQQTKKNKNHISYIRIQVNKVEEINN